MQFLDGCKTGLLRGFLASWLKGRRHHLWLFDCKSVCKSKPSSPAWPVLAGRKRCEVCRSHSVGKLMKNLPLPAPVCSGMSVRPWLLKGAAPPAPAVGAGGHGRSLAGDESYLPYTSGLTSILRELAPSQKRSVLPGKGARTPPASVPGRWERGQRGGQGCSEGMLPTCAMAW